MRPSGTVFARFEVSPRSEWGVQVPNGERGMIGSTGYSSYSSLSPFSRASVFGAVLYWPAQRK